MGYQPVSWHAWCMQHTVCCIEAALAPLPTCVQGQVSEYEPELTALLRLLVRSAQQMQPDFC
jgi:hypothetical protein